MGWKATSATCDSAAMGYTYQKVGFTISPGAPLLLHYTAAGQISGISVHVFGEQWPKPVALGFWVKQSFTATTATNKILPVYRMDVAFRSPNVM